MKTAKQKTLPNPDLTKALESQATERVEYAKHPQDAETALQMIGAELNYKGPDLAPPKWLWDALFTFSALIRGRLKDVGLLAEPYLSKVLEVDMTLSDRTNPHNGLCDDGRLLLGKALCCLVSLSDDMIEKYSPPFERLIPIRHGLAREAGIETEILTWLVMNEIQAWKAPWRRVESGIVYESLEVVRLHFVPSAPPIKRKVEDGLWVWLRDGEADPGADLMEEVILPGIVADPGADLMEEVILPGWKRGKLVLKQVPNGKTPAVFSFGSESYTVPSGMAWKTVCALISAYAFDGHGLDIPTPSGQFKREHRAFFSKRMAKNDSGWYIKTQ